MSTVAEKILAEIARQEEDWCFTPKDFMGLAERDALDKAFSRLTSEGVLRRIGRGVYDKPRYSAALKMILSPNPNQIARAVARRFGWRILPTGAYAANMLNLSTQVPMKIVYQSDGPTKMMKFEGWDLHFKHTSPKKLAASELGGLLINAFQFLGKDHVTPEMLGKLRRRFTEQQKEQLLEDAKYAPDWIYGVIRSICLQSEES